MEQRTVVLVGGTHGEKETLLQELLGSKRGGAWFYQYGCHRYDLRLLPICALQSPLLPTAGCTVLVTSALDLQRSLAAVPALWQRSHRLVVYVTGTGAARRRGFMVNTAALATALDCPVIVATPYSSRGVNRLLAAVERATVCPAVPHFCSARRMQTVWRVAVQPMRQVRRCTWRRAAVCVALWALVAVVLGLLCAAGHG